MASRVLTDQRDVDLAVEWLRSVKLPCTVTVVKGKQRTPEQNRLQRMWHLEAAEQLADETAEEKRGYCKLHFGIPILRAESDQYREAYDKFIRPLDYEAKLAMMMVPLDYPVTRLMTTAQKTQYLDAVWKHYGGLGVKLTRPGP